MEEPMLFPSVFIMTLRNKHEVGSKVGVTVESLDTGNDVTEVNLIYLPFNSDPTPLKARSRSRKFSVNELIELLCILEGEIQNLLKLTDVLLCDVILEIALALTPSMPSSAVVFLPLGP